jgi:hypothetical protein
VTEPTASEHRPGRQGPEERSEHGGSEARGGEEGITDRDQLLPDGPAERYLDTLFDGLAGTGNAGRRSLAEAEDHLRAASAAAVGTGLDREAAERQAVQRFGAAGSIAAQLQLTHRGVGALIRPLLAGAYTIGVVGALALGVSGLLSEISGHVFGAAFVSGDINGVTYTPARCADYFEYFPDAGSCSAAAALHHWGEVVEGRVALGVLGLLALGFGLVVRRGLAGRWAMWRPSAVMVALVTTALAGPAAVGLGGLSLLQLISGQHTGVGANLADGTVAGIVALAAAVLGLRARRLSIVDRG